jgi:hypothetical protein
MLERGVRDPCLVKELADEARFHVTSAPARRRRPLTTWKNARTPYLVRREFSIFNFQVEH